MARKCKDGGRLPSAGRAIEEEMWEAVGFDKFVD